MKKFYLIAIALLFSAAAFSQGVTTSAIGGKVTDNTGEALLGASIVAVHIPTGTAYGAATDFDGFYRISGMRTGGPYKVTISYVGFNDDLREGIFLNLGSTNQINSQMTESATALDEVVITAVSNGVFGSNKTGTETNISQRQVATTPAASRSIADFVRLTPQAQLSEGDDGFSISLAGQNNRYNAIYIDGAVNNDVFGLAGSGTNGGQTGVNPLSVDAIETFQINIAPFDVRQSGFSGGSINAVTRSGSNNFEGSAYYFTRNESLVGKTPGALLNEGDEAEKVSDFSANTYGVRLGGPLIEDKLFFFVNYERNETEIPQPFIFSNYTGRSSQADLDGLSSFLQNTYGYNPGIFDNNSRTLESNTLVAKLDWNINENNNLSLRHSYVGAENLEARSSGNRNIGFINGSEFFNSTTNSTALELNSRFGNKFSNNLIVGYTSVRDDRDPSGDPFPTVDIQDGDGTISFGSEPFSTANLLNTDYLTITNNFEIYAGRHTVTLGATAEFATVKNLFFAFNFGDYTFEDQFDDDGNLLSSGLNQFLTGQVSDVYQHGYSLVGDGTVGDESNGSADFKTFQAGFYVQDDFQMTDNFKVSFGARIDIPSWEDGTVNDDFNTTTIPLLEAAGKDLQGAQVGQGVGTAVFAPRLGFNWDVNGERNTQIRGGLGVFTSRLPLVWPGGTYNNNGVTGGFTFDATFFGPDAGQLFEPDVNNQFESVTPGSGGLGGNIDLIAENFKLPQVMKYNIAVDQKLPFWGLIASADFLYTDVMTDIYYENLNLGDPIGNYQGADGRPFYNRGDEIDDTYGRIILASNTGGGNATNATFTLRKPFDGGFAGSVSYTYGESNKIFDGTSSQNSSQWRNIQSVNGKNSDLPVTRSDFALGNRIVADASYQISWNENVKTTVALLYQGFQGSPYSFTYNEGRDIFNDDSRDNALIFIPASEGQIQFSGDAAEQAAQWAQLDNFINSVDHLRENRGGYAERNATRGPWSHIVDLKLLQDISFDMGGKKHTLQLTADVFNFGNLLNNDWGKLKFVRSNVSPLTTVSTGDIPVFSINTGVMDDLGNPDFEEFDDSGIQSSRWQAQLGVRYIFN
ncbi:carboxypeptidase regulatory-like domain-containing protein [Croceitalea sp. P059]|uniref:TonB-dependent receptor n=1 Tax=Croceitalea sp. P059 TaxID=3075601 RepID=UPI0028854E2B|nr:carboxypeptidase regulatory-like domain-containing protein [Croceitalea sp. P059]MDT0538497.1 carboxypeptidase regulatory-like domain-containing protein [Croceitalea sp. P059]